jgi:hypothetical protein
MLAVKRMRMVSQIFFRLAYVVGFLTISKINAYSQVFYSNSDYPRNLIFDGALSVGGINAMVDVGGNIKKLKGPISSFTVQNTNLAVGVSLTATYKRFVAARLEYTSGSIEGADSLMAKNFTNRQTGGRINRNLSFKTPLREVALSVELHPFSVWRNSEKKPAVVYPYLLGGAGIVFYNPQAEIDGRWVDLRPLRLEGQGFAEYPSRKMYGKSTYALLLGGGIKVMPNPGMYIRMEMLGRYTGTDYLDDVSQRQYVDPMLFASYLSAKESQLASRLFYRNKDGELPGPNAGRGNPGRKDIYWTAMIKFGFIINNKTNGGKWK